MKILFLDFDGVLNYEKFLRSYAKSVGPSHLDPDCVQRVARLVEQEKLHVVISSAWRTIFSLNQLKKFLGDMSFPSERIVDVTESFSQTRGYEIHKWIFDRMQTGQVIESVVILDDTDNMVHLSNRLVLTDFNRGFQDDHLELARAIITRPWDISELNP